MGSESDGMGSHLSVRFDVFVQSMMTWSNHLLTRIVPEKCNRTFRELGVSYALTAKSLARAKRTTFRPSKRLFTGQ